MSENVQGNITDDLHFALLLYAFCEPVGNHLWLICCRENYV